MQINRDIKEIFVFQRLVGGGNGIIANVYAISFLHDENVIELNSSDDYITLQIHQKP